MAKWRCVSALLVWSGAVGCATATNGGNPFGTDNGGDSSVLPAGGSDAAGSASAGAPSVAGAPAGGSPSAVGGSASAGTSSGGAKPAGGASNGGSSSGGSGQAGGAGKAGASGGGAASTAGAGGGTSSGPCMNPTDVKGGNSGNLGVGAACLRTTETFNTVGCSNWTGRTIKVNGVLATCSVKTTFAPMIGGFNYFEVSSGAGAVAYASFNWFTS